MRSEEGDTYSECFLYKLSTLIAVSVALHFQRYIISLISEFVGLDGVVMEGRRWGEDESACFWATPTDTLGL